MAKSVDGLALNDNDSVGKAVAANTTPAVASPRKTRRTDLPARVGATPAASVEDLDAPTLARILCASDAPRTITRLRNAACLAGVSRQLRATVARSGQLPPIGVMVSASRLVLPDRVQASFEAGIAGRIAALPHRERTIAINLMIDEFIHVAPGYNRSLRFDALLQAAAALPAESATGAMTRLASCLRLLPQDASCTDRATRFSALLQHCYPPQGARIDTLCALARQIRFLSALDDVRPEAIRTMQRQASTLKGPAAARVMTEVAAAIPYLEAAEMRDDLAHAMPTGEGARTLDEVLHDVQAIPEAQRIDAMSNLIPQLGHVPHLGGALAVRMTLEARNWPAPARARVVASIAAVMPCLNVSQQCHCIRYLGLLTNAMPEEDRSVAITQRAAALQHVADKSARQQAAAKLHIEIMHRHSRTCSELLPAWVKQLTPFVAGSEREEILFSIHRETIQYARSPAAAARIMQELATHLGNFSNSSQTTVAEELRCAAGSMPPELGHPILATLDLQRTCALVALNPAAN